MLSWPLGDYAHTVCELKASLPIFHQCNKPTIRVSEKKPANRTSWGQLNTWRQLHDSNDEKCLPHHCVSCQVGQQVFSKHSTEQEDWWEEQHAPVICWRILSYRRTHCIAMNSSLFENDALVEENVVHVESLKCHSCVRGNNLSFGFLAFLFYSSKSSHISFLIITTSTTISNTENIHSSCLHRAH